MSSETNQNKAIALSIIGFLNAKKVKINEDNVKKYFSKEEDLNIFKEYIDKNRGHF